MGSWDCYCAICGGPFGGVQISEKPRITRQEAVRRAHQHRYGQREGTPHTKSAGDGENDYDGEGDDESVESDEDEYDDYNPAIISEEDTAWTRTLHILGFNVHAPGVSKAFVSGPGTYSDYGGVDVEPGNDPNLIEDGFFSCYYDFDNGDNPVFPFHWCCYELLATALTGTSDVTKIDKDLLFSVMHELSSGPRLDLDYGDPGPEAEQFWISTPGMEFLVAQPITPDLANIVKATIASCDFILPSSEHDLGSRVKHDPFMKLPYDLIHNIVCLLPIKSLLDLEKASWPVHSVLRENPSFWQESIKRTMPWFFEVQELMKVPQNIQGNGLKGLLLWADEISTPRTKMTGPFMGLANRRRIWDACEQLAALYLPRWHQKDGPRPGFIENMIRTQSACVHLPVVSSPVPFKKNQALAYWVRDWEDVYARRNVLEVFWDGEGSLIGISVTPDGERRLFGNDDTNQRVSKQAVEIKKGDWITGFILHIPGICLHKGTPKLAPGIGSHLWTCTSIKGITILYKSGTKSHLGATESKYSKRPLLVSEDMYVVGVMGQIGPNQQIIRLGLLQAKRPEFEDYSVAEENISTDAPPPPPFEKCLWRDDNSTIEGTASDRLQSDVHDDMIPYEALIWAKDELELRRVTRLTGYVVVGGTISGRENGYSYSRDVEDLCGIRAEFTSEYGGIRRLIGCRKEDNGEDWLKERCVPFNIDGPGGEYVNEISFAKHEAPKAVKLRTNRGREVYWGEKKTSNWQTLRAPEGETIVGIVMTFGIRSGLSHETRTYVHTKLSSVAALSLPLGVQ